MKKEDFSNMVHFALRLIFNASHHKNIKDSDIIDQRIMILNLDHANELLMKAFLMRKDYVINLIDRKEIKKGLKKGQKIDSILNKDKTLDYLDCLDIVSNIINLNQQSKEKIIKFHKIRNEIQHRSLDLEINKEEEISHFYPCFKELYQLMFPDFAESFPEILN